MKQIYIKSLVMVLSLFISINVFASLSNLYSSHINSGEEPQNKTSYLVHKYFNTAENNYELEFLSNYLQTFNTGDFADYEKALADGHEYFIEHQEEIINEIKKYELQKLKEQVKRDKAQDRAELWAPLLEALPNILSTAVAVGMEAGQQQQTEYQNKINRDKEIQAYIAQHSSSSPKQYSQNFGATHDTNATNSYRKVTTSNGYDEPLPSAPISNKSDVVNTSNSGERIIQGVFIYNSQKAVVNLRYNSGRITAYSTSRDALNKEQWITIYPDNPHPTMEIQDGNITRDYKYKVSGDGKVFYFNL